MSLASERVAKLVSPDDRFGKAGGTRGMDYHEGVILGFIVGLGVYKLAFCVVETREIGECPDE
jgi:hypothetical protein